MNIAEQYIKDVLNKQIVVGEAITLQCQRHTKHLQQQESKDFPYYFDCKAAEHILKFASKCFFGTDSLKGKPFKLEGWQAALLWQLYGWKTKKTDSRKYDLVFTEVARKNGKTELLALIGNYAFTSEAFTGVEKDPQVYWVATKKEQAKIGWDKSKEQLKFLRKASPKVRNYSKVLTYSIKTSEGLGGIFYLGKDSDKQDGFNPYVGLIDEYHAHKTDDAVNVIESGQGARESPFIFIITTAGDNINGPCKRLEDNCLHILKGTIINENILPWIHRLDDGDDWEDPKNWIKANPNLGVSVKLENLERRVEKARTLGAEKEFDVKTKNFNIWVTGRISFIPDEVYKKCMGVIDYEALKGKIAYGGLDLASTRDTTCLALHFPIQEGLKKPTTIWKAWVPEDNIRQRVREDKVPYLDWAKEGWLSTTPGNVTDYNWIQEYITKCFELYNIQSIAYDRFNSSQLVIELTNNLGFPMAPFGQGFISMNAPTKEYQRLMLINGVNVGQDPIARWHNSNISLRKDPAGNIKIDKEKSIEKVDLQVAHVMAIGEKMDKHSNQGSIYDGRELIII